MDVLKRIGDCKIVPVVVISKAEDAVPTAKALLAGGVDVMEITLRTPAGIESVRRVSEQCPEVCVGAGTVITLDMIEEPRGSHLWRLRREQDQVFFKGREKA